MKSTAATVNEYLKGLPEDRKEAISAVRKVILDNLPQGYEEAMQHGMISYVVPHSIYPAGYHCKPSEPLMKKYIADVEAVLKNRRRAGT